MVGTVKRVPTLRRPPFTFLKFYKGRGMGGSGAGTGFASLMAAGPTDEHLFGCHCAPTRMDS